MKREPLLKRMDMNLQSGPPLRRPMLATMTICYTWSSISKRTGCCSLPLTTNQVSTKPLSWYGREASVTTESDSDSWKRFQTRSPDNLPKKTSKFTNTCRMAQPRRSCRTWSVEVKSRSKSSVSKNSKTSSWRKKLSKEYPHLTNVNESIENIEIHEPFKIQECNQLKSAKLSPNVKTLH